MSRRPPARRPGPPRPTAPHTCVFRVRFRGSPYTWMGTPPSGEETWREIEVRADQTLGDLGAVIPAAFDFTTDHAWSFFLSGQAWDARTEYARPGAEGVDGRPKRPADRLRVHEAPVGGEFLFMFDYGDEWHFGVRLQRTGDVEPDAAYPRVVAANSEIAPEDLEPTDDVPFLVDPELLDADGPGERSAPTSLDFLHAAHLDLDDDDLENGDFEHGDLDDEDFDDDEEDERLAEEAAGLVEHFESWATVRGVAEQARIVARLVDYKLDVDQETPRSWTAEDLKDLLLEWCPEELVLEPGELELLLPSMRSFLTFLDHTGQLAPEGTRLAALDATLDWIAPKLGARMRDPSRFGPVKRAVTAMRAAGVDADDHDAVAEFLAGWEPSEDDLPGEPPVLPPVRLPGEEELRAAAAQSPTVTQLATLARWVGDGGRKLTARGHLTLADAKDLCVTLGLATPAQVAAERPRSARDLPGVALAVEWAKLTGLVRARAGRLELHPDNRRLIHQEHELAGRALDSLTALGDLALPAGVDAPTYAHDLEAALLELLVLLYEGEEAVSLADFAVHVWEDHVLPELEAGLDDLQEPDGAAGPGGLGGLRDVGLDDDDLEVSRLTTAVNVMAVAGHLQQLGIIELEGDPDEVGTIVVGAPGTDDQDTDPVPDLDAIQVRLTPLGLWKTNRVLRDSGANAPVLGDLAGAGAGALIDGCAAYDEESCEEELRAWCAARDPGAAAAELAAYARDRAPDHEHRMLALLALELVGPAAHDHVRGLLTDPDLRAHAQLWLVRNGAADERILDPDATVWVLADVLAATLDADGPASMVEQLDELGPPELQLAALRDLEQATHPRLADVCEAIGRAHPDDEVARAARKAAMKLGPPASPEDGR